jgi:2'-5' RNA ligase
VGGDERLRLFVGLRLPDEAVAGLLSWQERELPRREPLRPVPAENLHVTLAFLGSRPAVDADRIAAAMRSVAVQATTPFVLRPVRYRETRSVGMVVLDDLDGRASAFARRLWAELEGLGVFERESRDWLAHVTVVRFRERPRLRLPAPELGPLSPSEVALYHSVLRRDGARYEVLESAELGG